MKAVLGFDTSCYTTSAAIVSLDGTLLSSARRLLDVPKGGRGLQQSAGVFQHVQRLPELARRAIEEAGCPELAAVCASVRPRPVDGSYMPVFRVGESQARTAAALLGVPFYAFSHQEGHVSAALVDAGIDRSAPFLALHLSGGTTEMLLCRAGKLTLLGGSLDLHAGQLLDRVGVKMGFSFPAGPEMEKLARMAHPQGVIGVSIKGRDCCIAGAENKAQALLMQGMPKEQVAAELFDFLARTIERMLEAGCDNVQQALLAGGVASSLLLREMLEARARKRGLHCKICYARPELSGDNAVGIALLGAEAYRQERG